MKSIGGFLGLEIPQLNAGAFHKTYALTTGRACLNFILKKINPKKIYIPYYTCDALLEPIVLNQIDFEYYAVDAKLDPVLSVKLAPREYFVYINYFGVKSATVKKMVRHYGNKLIIDNTQAFFEKGYPFGWSFNSVRKFFGAPDGAYLYSPAAIKQNWNINAGVQWEHLILRNTEKQDLAYKKYLRWENSVTCEILGMSETTENILKGIHYSEVADIRRSNFDYLHSQLGGFNQMNIDLKMTGVPHSYPFWPKKCLNRKKFHQQQIFIPTFWERKKCLRKGFDLEDRISRELLPLPIDQRYKKADLKRMIVFIKQLMRVTYDQ